ncbi:hypothetical protein CkaCkLH20_07571 [Colletotrichum karsti]|uniref:Avirulence Effector AvrLm4-7 domain-containing protein n=1 Tax=Colletotrichum karsti TaxID=1095194 RepID=A0A9P6LJS7_9PEZI|nr:uncharacterized protein CkaCkLH20_07571 [Colletotrichum karsti]KAF9874877.1 hypothetical protein CkaCkLH20_07571 [Colletotrichum karsti]
MQFSIALLSVVACATGVAANLHLYAYCADRVFEGINESNPENNDATQVACDKYKARNTGTQQWDTCPDCTTSLRGDVLVCNSLAKHIGGDEWDYYCKNSGADMGKAS